MSKVLEEEQLNRSLQSGESVHVGWGDCKSVGIFGIECLTFYSKWDLFAPPFGCVMCRSVFGILIFVTYLD